jgi:hypothetical protein
MGTEIEIEIEIEIDIFGYVYLRFSNEQSMKQ